jgi:hypothetical protein
MAAPVRARLPVTLLAAVLVLTACSGGDPMNAPRESLEQQPTLAQAVDSLGEMAAEVERRLGAELGLTAWSTSQEAGESLCGEGEVEDARVAYLPTRALAGGVPDADWERAVDVLVDVVSGYGFGPPETVVDDPGEHEVVLVDEREALVRFGTLQNATLEVVTGCHLLGSTPS